MKRFLIRTEVDDEEIQTEEAQENIPTQKRTSTTSSGHAVGYNSTLL